MYEKSRYIIVNCRSGEVSGHRVSIETLTTGTGQSDEKRSFRLYGTTLYCRELTTAKLTTDDHRGRPPGKRNGGRRKAASRLLLPDHAGGESTVVVSDLAAAWLCAWVLCFGKVCAMGGLDCKVVDVLLS